MTSHRQTDSSPPEAAGRGNRVVLGIACAFVAIFLFAIYNALSKWLTADYSPWQIMFFRGAFGLVPFAAYALLFSSRAALRSRQPKLQVVRAALGFSANLFFIYAYRQMPLADAIAIGYAAPIFVVFLSVPLLSEKVGLWRASAAFVGFTGVLMIAQPGPGIFTSGALYAMAGTLCYALLLIVTRRVGSSDSALCTVLISTGLYTLAAATLLPSVWVTPNGQDLALLSAVGLVATTAMLLFVFAFRHAEAAVLAPLDYVSMLWAALFGFFVWGEIPTAWAVAGMATIAGSGLVITARERLRRRSGQLP